MITSIYFHINSIDTIDVSIGTELTTLTFREGAIRVEERENDREEKNRQGLQK